MDVNLLTKIKTLYPQMTVSEKSVAEFILNNPEELYNLQIESLANNLKISIPTIFRFAQKLGFKGFKDFKIELIKCIAIQLNISIGEIDSNDDFFIISKNIFKKITDNIEETFILLDFDQLKLAVNEINQAKRLMFFAIGTSLPVAYDSYMNFQRAGFNCFFDMDSYTQRTLSTQCNPSDVAIGISFSGESVEVVACLKNAQENGAKTICITTFMNSAITKYSTIKLFTAPVMFEMQKIDLPSKKSQTALLDVIYLNAVLKKRKQSLKYISKSEEALKKPIKL